MDLFWKLLINFGPILLLIGVWIYVMRRGIGKKQNQYFEHVKDYMSEHIAEVKRLNANLERIVSALETQKDGPRPPGS